jgi:6-phosphogluconolactonase
VNAERSKTVYYASIGPELVAHDIDVDGAALTRRSAVTLPVNVQYAWPHPSRRMLYVASSNGGGGGLVGDTHRANALTIDAATGALRHLGTAAVLPSRPIHTSVDRGGQFLLTAYNSPSHITVHRLNADGSIGAEVAQPERLDTGIYAHQVLAAPDNAIVVLVTRGNDAKPGKPEDPGAIKTYRFEGGVLRNLASIAPGSGHGFGPRHLDFHPTKPWVFVSIERQNKLFVYARDDKTGLTREPLFVKDTLANPHPRVRQAAAAIHVHPNGKFVYVTNRASDLVAGADGSKAFTGGENNVAVFAIDETTGEPTLIQNADAHAIELRTFGIEPSGRMLVAASIRPLPFRDAGGMRTVPPRQSVYAIGSDGRLTFKRHYDIDTGSVQQFWSGMVTLA